ncbi:MAG: zinc ribbon domain-containing protein [Nocardioidaceae bacterium]
MAVRGQEPTLKADPFAQLYLLDLQALDSTLAQLAHRKKSLPEHERLEQLAARRKELDGRRVEAETRVSDLAREQKKADGEVEHVKARRVRDQQRLESGQITAPKDLENLQHEVVALDRRIGTLEDEELEVMEALEQAQTDLEAVAVETAEVAQQVEEAEAARDTAVAEIDAKGQDATAERARTAEKVPEPLLTLYDKVRTHHSGLGAAALRQRRCEGCRLELNGADIRELSALPSDEVLRCPECDRILVRTDESGL